ncbi:hypothetical protein LTR10_019488 [Elasticomyces elasticus]|uniref:Uncharacterized protein n=1 Tax=Exophiala sideris TaxID=1016849 RepID=A0ABR0JKD1_9EURO|nr:hypothetical protein LTR10_019488 [Elasticomyces elasticus]KAK5035508.1 hypothetical protein LTS07_002947 [Exophiala sideris]KAK5039140.1 hypothetical protein LTR13_003396 [Exophiala sideris]KAK5066433.1 hypothetical protein LTR69_002953 [Exophiala sideris]KAK5187110.1 hypothetical protein LTR44_001118 [Eurotiomycetes sp. CCFEE 6388]
MHVSSIRAALANVFQIPARSTARNTNALSAASLPTKATGAASASFSTSTPRAAKKGGKVRTDRRITLIRYFLYHPTTLTPRPLRFSRNRYLRHWTIHRAWQLYRAKVRESRQLELERQYNAMNAANEELRVGAGDGGRLFRKAQMKTGIWSIPERGGGVPIEYARGLVEWMGSTGGLGSGGTGLGAKAKVWDSDWKRS